jgi:DNA-nicking Smr family endonuclease
MPSRARSLSEADRAEWAIFARLITPLPGRTAPASAGIPPPAAVLPKRPRPPIPVQRARSLPSAVAIGAQPGGIDNGTWQRFRTGKLAVSRKLDLHGLTTQHAFHALTAFLRTAHADRVRCVEVVTGRGNPEGGGTIRRELP